MQGAGGRLTGTLAMAALIGLGACSRPADAVPAGSRESPPPATAADAAAAPGASPGAAAVTEATCATAPLRVRVVAVRRETQDSVRVDLALANLAPAETWSTGSPAAAAVQAAVEALDQASVLSADGRRRMFALRVSTGERVGSRAVVPGPGRTETFSALFPAAEGQLTVLLPGFSPLTGLAVAAPPGRPEP
jgi:hypothetical protein